MNTNLRVRKSFAKSKEAVEKPHLIDLQRISYEKFLQLNVDPDEREDSGLQTIFRSRISTESVPSSLCVTHSESRNIRLKSALTGV